MCSKLSKKYARDLRRAQTREEALLWDEIRNRKLDGVKFMRQHPISIQKVGSTEEFVIADFYCASYRFIIELDGGYHKMITAIDTNRDELLTGLFGIKTLRFKNEELSNMPKVLTTIRAFIETLGPPLPF